MKKKKKKLNKKIKIKSNKVRIKKNKKTKTRINKIKKNSLKRRKKLKVKKKIKNKVKKKKYKIYKKPIDRLRSIKFRIPKIKRPKIKLKIKKKQIQKIKKHTAYVTKISFQNVINFLLNPFFKAYDNYFENKKIRKLERIDFEKKEKEKQVKEDERKKIDEKRKEIQFEKKLERERKDDLKRFIQEGQAQLRKDLQEKKRKLYESMQIQRKLDQFANREARECAHLERLAIKENIAEYKNVQEAIERIRLKYKLIRENKIKERIEALGISVESGDTREDLYRKEKEFNEQRLQVEIVLESFFRSSQSLIFQINKRWLPKKSEILRVIDRRWEENLFYIRYDDEIEENFIFLVYLEDNNKTITIEDKSDESKQVVKKFQTNMVFSFSDYLTDRIVAHLDRIFQKGKELN